MMNPTFTKVSLEIPANADWTAWLLKIQQADRIFVREIDAGGYEQAYVSDVGWRAETGCIIIVYVKEWAYACRRLTPLRFRIVDDYAIEEEEEGIDANAAMKEWLTLRR